MRNNAVLYEQEGLCYLLGKDSRSTAVHTPGNIGDFITLAEEFHVDVIWVMPGLLSRMIDWEFVGNYDRSKFSIFPDSKMQGVKTKKPSYIRIRRARIEAFQREYFLAIPEHEDWRDSGKSWFCPTPQDLLTTVTYLEEEYPTFAWSPQNVGKSLLRQIHEKKGWQIADTIMTDHLKKVINRSVQRPTWVRDGGLSSEQRRMRYLVCADKNAQYVGGCRSVLLGNGQYIQVGKERFDEKTPGLWYAQVVSIKESLFDSFRAFCPWTSPRQWFSTDLLVAARSAGIQFEILEGIIWEEYKPYMDLWAKEIWQHRAAFQDETRFPVELARLNAAASAKQIGNSFIGLVAAAQKAPGKGMIYRPDWNIMIIHKAISNLMYSVKSRHDKHGILPVLLARGDTQWFATDDPDIPGLFDHSQEQRGSKLVGHPVLITREIIKLFREKESGAKGNEQKASMIAEILEREARS